jgi:spore coat protein U-like protein
MNCSRILITLLAGAGMIAGADQAMANPTTTAQGVVDVSATLTAACYIGNGTLAFGDIVSIGEGATPGTKADAADKDVDSSAINYVCSNGATATLQIDSELKSGSQLRMTDGTHYLAYNIYTDPSRTSGLVTPALTNVSLTADGNNQTITLYGRVPGASANQVIGYYSDTLTLTVSYDTNVPV